MGLFSDSPEFKLRKAKPFSPTKVRLVDIHAAVPKYLYKKNAFRASLHISRDILCAIALYQLAWEIETFLGGSRRHHIIKWALWVCYWVSQSIVFTGWWCMGHEACHGNVSEYRWINHLVGFFFHTLILSPYFAWRSTHHLHHKATASIEREENYVPRTRSDLNLPPEPIAIPTDYHEILEETPMYTVVRMLIMQLLGWNMYLFTHTLGSPRHPKGTNHFNPSSTLFKPHDRWGVVASDIGLISMCLLLYKWTQTTGISSFLKFYFVPYMLLNHWIIMLTFLQHSDPTIPMYRNRQWSFLRGALSTVDRPLLGWAGRIFLHNAGHDHIAHHLFTNIPWYNQPHVTNILKELLGNDYNYDSTNVFYALYRTSTQCRFVEDNGDIVFYKNKDGKAARELAHDALNYPAC
ncbi:delta-12 fatty acid desaturase [Rhodocollybia butyracea]|uniref:Delta-12 fatty acid desaturase n=1 Tax=Rhodocollybia butyracea TaxID=206335 RepID=A0A9P5PN61_9AGAR|nr:delta-12 fatty acid desaturase [Rhodocollybia butyracea]